MIKTKEENFTQNFEVQIPEELKKPHFLQNLIERVKKINRKLIFIGLGMIIFIIALLIIIFSSFRIAEFKPAVFPSPSPSPFEEEIINPSAYATDSAVLEIEKRLKEIEQNLDKTDLKETSLNPPVLDIEINFEE